MLNRNQKNQTLKQYQTRCNQLEDEINVLKSAIYQLSVLPNGISVGLDRQTQNLQTNIQENQDTNKIKKSVEMLINAMSDLQLNKQVDKANIFEFVKKGTCILGKMIVTLKDQRTFEYAEKLLQAETNEQALLLQFTQVLDESVNWVNEQINFCRHNHSDLPQQKDMSKLIINEQINHRLSQLIEHLIVPDELSRKFANLKANLDRKLTVESLGEVVDNLADLVTEAFNLEHHHLKGYLNIFASNLHNFDDHLKESNQNNLHVLGDSKELETGVLDNIKTIRFHIEHSKSIQGLANKVDVNLESISTNIKKFRRNEAKHIKTYEVKISNLQTKLTETFSIVENLKEQLASHKVQINQDFLTHLPDRAAFEEHILKAFHRWQRGYGEISVGLANIDHFKVVNDKSSYLAGDKVLKEMAILFKSSVRSVDFIARFSGEEFIFIFEHTSAHEALKVLDNLRLAVQDNRFNYEEIRLAITVSIGLSSFQHGDTVDSVMNRVVKAMQKAKESGRNRLILIEN
ncbi:MAG: GGDEF domain-containing protein [Tatlockia sp.]|nr:GGDEF domain-containing protein [Tatlockia sp.]